MIYRYDELNKPILNLKMNDATVARLILENGVVNCGTLLKLLAEKVGQIVSKFFVLVCSTIGMNNITATEYYQQTKDRTEGFNSNPVSPLHHFVSDHQTVCDTYLLLNTYT